MSVFFAAETQSAQSFYLFALRTNNNLGCSLCALCLCGNKNFNQLNIKKSKQEETA